MRTCDLSLLPTKQYSRLLHWQYTNSKWYGRAHYAKYVVKTAQCLTGCCVIAHTSMSSQAMCASHLNGAGSSQLRTSVSKAAGWGRENAQLLGVMAGITAGLSAGLFWLGTYVSENKVLKQKVSNVEELMKQKVSNVEELMKQKLSDVEELIKDRELSVRGLRLRTVEEKVKADREVVEEKVKAAKADGAKETADRFLMFGYAAEYEKFQKKVEGNAAANNAGGVGSV